MIDLNLEDAGSYGERRKLNRVPDLTAFRNEILGRRFAMWDDLEAYLEHLRDPMHDWASGEE